MSQDVSTSLNIKVKKRNNQTVAFNEIRVKKAIGNAFKEHLDLPREVELSITAGRDVERITNAVFSVLKERTIESNELTVEEIQDEVIRQLYENGFKEVGELYANYRKAHAARRTLFELYSTTKRDGKVVSFKPDKITSAIAKVFRACNNGILTEDLLHQARTISQSVVNELQETWPKGTCIHIEEIQDLVEKNLMKSSYHDVARRFILYREEHARVRRAQQIKESSQENDDVDLELAKKITFKTTAGEEKPLCLDDLRFTIETCCLGLENVSAEKILKESLKNYFNGITEEHIAASNILAAKAFVEEEPEYAYAASRLLLLKCYQEALGLPVSFERIKMEYASYFDQYIHKAVELELLSPDLLQYDLKRLGHG